MGHLENTLPAFESARSLGADMVELDCRLTRDGQVVVLHDATLARLWGVPRPIGELTWEEAGTLRRGHYRLPLLAEVLEAVELPVMVDLPDPMAAGPSWSVALRSGAAGRCIFAGNATGLARLRMLSQEVRIALSWDSPALPPASLLATVKPEWWNPHHRLVGVGTVEWAHAAGMAVSVWTADSRRDIARALDAGADAVISNRVAEVVLELSHRQVGGTPPSGARGQH